MTALDASHDPKRRSWVASADGHPDFPIQNLPFGIFSPPGGTPRAGIAIGDAILDLPAAARHFTGDAATACQAANGTSLNQLMDLGGKYRVALRLQVSDLLEAGHAAEPSLLHDAGRCTLHLPAAIGDYTDFYAGIHHATNVGKQFRPDNPLLPNYKYVPIGYHGRASSIRVSGGEVRRPNGQRKPAAETIPSFGPSRNLDYELELGVWMGRGNPPGQPIPIAESGSRIAGFCLLNDWSARDIQAWEYQPLGPFLAKNFHTTISPWVITAEALAPFRARQPARPEGDPRPLAYLWDDTDQATGALDIDFEVLIATSAMRAAGTPPHRLSRTNAGALYWTVAQFVAHHASGGCDLHSGDLFGSGTISGTTPDSYGSLLELSEGGRKPLALPNGETRRFLEDGDEILFRASCRRDGFVPIGFGDCRGTIVSAHV